MSLLAPEIPLDLRLARTAISLTLDHVLDDDGVVDRLVELAGGNRTAVARALRRVSARSRAAAALRLTLARGEWAW